MRDDVWECVIGLEVHAQVVSKSKLFSSSSTQFGSAPNENVSLIDSAMPGMLPVLNDYCIEQAIKTGLALDAKINNKSVFDRKNYFYPDLPQGYQISQFYHPIVSDGKLDITDADGARKQIRIERIHLEQDAGKSVHDQLPGFSLVDLNRAGIALMEIVTRPDISSAEEAAEFVKKLRTLFRYIGTCDGNMEKGSLRCDANISVRKKGQPLGTRCEIKNLNSIKNLVAAIEYEIQRQIEVLESGGVIDQETKLFDSVKNVTRTMRSKEDAQDYRYFPDPDLLPVIVSDDMISEIKDSLPELPDAKFKRYIDQYGLNDYDASVITSDIDTTKYFEECIENGAAPKLSANWILSELFARLNKANVTIVNSKVNAVMLSGLMKSISDNVITGKIAKTVLDEMFETGKNASDIIKEKGLVQISDSDSLKPIIEKILQDNQKSVEDFKNGKTKLMGFFVGQVMKKTGGKANPKTVNELLNSMLS